MRLQLGSRPEPRLTVGTWRVRESLLFAGGFWLRDELPDVPPGVLFLVPAGGAIAVYVCWLVIKRR